MYQISSNEVMVFQQSLRVSAQELQEYRQLLSADEKDRANRFVQEKDQRKFIVARGRLRQLIGEYMGISPKQLMFTYNSYGKPEIKSKSSILHFNLSHSNEMAVYVLSASFEVGIDIEYLKPHIEIEEIAKRFFSVNESTALIALPAEQKLLAFYQCWTRKEALLKALGEGLSFPLDKCEVSLAPGKPARIISIQDSEILAAEWYMQSFGISNEYVGAVVVHGHVDMVRFMEAS